MGLQEFKQKAIAEVIDREGGSKYTNRPADLGGPTRWGVTHTKAKEVVGYTGDMRDFPYELAYKVYEHIWNRLRCDDICTHSSRLGLFVFDYGVNSGEYRSALCLQQLLNALNNRGRLYPDIKADGIMGTKSLRSLISYKQERGQRGLHVLCTAFNSERMTFCVNLAKRREEQEENLYGWLVRVHDLSANVPAK